MDIDRYIARNEAGWNRLEQLTASARRGVSGLSPAELDELVQLYQRVSSQLSYVRTYYRDSPLVARLTRIVASANGVVYGKRARTLSVVRDFFLWTFPGAVWQCRKAILWSTLLFFGTAAALHFWLTLDPGALDALVPRPERVEYVRNQFEQYYSEDPQPVFFSRVTVNNTLVSFQIFGSGIVVPFLGPLYILASNGANLGVASAMMASENDYGRFLGFILPHGMLELTAIVIAGGASLALGWALVVPGDRPRSVALREEGRRLVVIILGLMVVFLAAGTIEGFITGSGLPTVLRVGVGALGWLVVVLYFVVRGRAAAARGLTGGWGELQRVEAEEERATLRAMELQPPSGPNVTGAHTDPSPATP